MRRSVVLVFLLIFLPASLRLLAQVTTASIFGTVTDASSAVMRGVEVKATQIETNFTRSDVTDDAGQYAIKFLPVGSYRVEVAVQGFKTFTQTGIVLEINRNARVDPVMQVGALAETVQVNSDAPLINTADASIGRTVSNSEIQNMPLVNRDLYALLSLTPGVDQTDATNPLGSPAQITVVNGSSSGTGSINYYLDGGNNTQGLRNTGNALPNPDAVQEFRVITNSYGAEFGRYAAGMVDVVTKSGSNSVHGSLFEFLRNDVLNASNWNALTKPPLRRNQFGGSFGGPIIKDRTFYFGSYSGLRQRRVDFSQAAIVPTALERAGNFSASATKPKDPLLTGTCSATVTAACFPGNIIPANRLDPTAQRIISASIPLPNLFGNHFEATVPHPLNSDELVFKFDHRLSNSHQLSGSYYYQAGEDIEGMQGNLPWSTRAFEWTQQNYNIGDTWTVSPTLVNQLRLTYVRNFGGRNNEPVKSLADFGSKFQVQGVPALPNISVTGYFTLGQAIAGPTAGSNYYGLRELLNWTKGHHFLKIGGEFALEKNIHDTLLNNYGTFSFTGAKSGNAAADFVLGLPATMNQDAPVTKYNNGWYYALFVQDDFRIHPRLILNLGLRYDMQTPFTDPYDRQLAFVKGAKSTKVPSAPLGLQFPGDPGITRGITKMDKNNLAPRIGLAWDPFGDGKTSVRAGAGVFFGSISANEWNQTTDFQPFSARQQFNDVKSMTDPYANLPGGVSPYPYVYDPTRTLFLANASITSIALDFKWPYTYQFNLSLQRQLTSKLSITAAYVGALGHRWPTIRDINYPIYGPGATAANVNSRRPIQPVANTYAVINDIESTVNNAYHGLQVSVERRFSQNFSFKGFYAFSKALEGGNEASANGATGWQNANNQAEDRGRTNSDRRHNFVMAVIWNIDYFKGSNVFLRELLNRWSLAANMSARSGTPLTISAGSDINLDGINNDRASLNGKPKLDANRSRPEVLAKWFDTTVFSRSATGQDGTGGRNIVDRPGSKNVDLAFFRDFRLREGMSLQFRCEVTNVFNLVNLSGPNTTLTSTAFGTITGAAAMRQVQLGLRISF